MNKKEIFEIKKQYTEFNYPITRICGCYVDAEKYKKAEFVQTYMTLQEGEYYKYMTIFRKVMSGSIGTNLLTMEFPLEAESKGGAQEFLMKLKNSQLKDDDLLEEFYNKIIDSYNYNGNYLILLTHAVYDVPGKGSDNVEMFDASDEIYEHIICCICPVIMSKSGLSYHEEKKCFTCRTLDWTVENPVIGFLFPAFHDRSADVHSFLYYMQKTKAPGEDFVSSILDCELPMTAEKQKEAFKVLVEDMLGEDCNLVKVREIQADLNEMLEEQKENPTPLILDKENMRRLFVKVGINEERLSDFDRIYNDAAGDNTEFVVTNVAKSNKFEVKTTDVTIQVNPDRSDLIQERTIDGRKYLLIEMENRAEVNGIVIK